MKEQSTNNGLQDTVEPFSQVDSNFKEAERIHKIGKLKIGFTKPQIKRPDLPDKNKKPLSKKPFQQNFALNFRGIDLLKIRDYLSDTRIKNRNFSDPLSNQKYVTKTMRAVLFNWLIEVTIKCQLKTRTIFLCAFILDKYLISKSVPKSALQLLGVTCLYIASKFEDVYPPKIKDLCSLCDNIYAPQQIISLEAEILLALNFDLIFVSALDVLEVQLAIRSNSNNGVNRHALFIFYAFMIQGTINMIDSFKLADFVNVFILKQTKQDITSLDFCNISNNENERFEQYLKHMVVIIRKHHLSALEKELDQLPEEIQESFLVNQLSII